MGKPRKKPEIGIVLLISWFMRRTDPAKMLLPLLLAFRLSAHGQTDTARCQLMLKQFRAWYNDRQYDSLYGLLTPALKAALTPDAWRNTLANQIMPAVGTVGPFVFDVAHAASTVFIANAETQSLALQLSVDKDLLANGLHVVLPKKEATDSRKPQTPVPPYSYNSEELEYDNADKSVHFGATLTYPKTGGPFPTLLLITGSGIQDRDETLLGHKPFAVLADFLTKKGYAVLRVDDRGAGKTKGNVTDASSADFAKDVEAGLDYLETRKEVNPKKLGLLGHSEGGVIAPMVAARRKEVDFIILWGAPMVGGTLINIEQNRLALKKGGIGNAAAAAFIDLHTRELAAFKTFTDTVGLRDKVMSIFRDWKKQQPDSLLQQLYVTGNTIIGKDCFTIYDGLFENPWMRFFLTHDFAGDLSKVGCKVLAINGEKDTQVEPGTNLKKIRETLLKNGNKSITTVELKGLNHLLQTANTGDFSEYANIKETISPLALQVIGDWLDKTVGP
jgi:pimeloyl-ACP methyl ester carboxylesterase